VRQLPAEISLYGRPTPSVSVPVLIRVSIAKAGKIAILKGLEAPPQTGTALSPSRAATNTDAAAASEAPSAPFRTRLWIALALVAACIVVFGRVVHFDFLNYDDNAYITDNQWIRGGLTAAGIRFAFLTIDYPSYWHPGTWLSHMIDCQLFGLNPGGHHLTNLLLHITNTLLVFAVFRRLTGALWRSAILAVLFAVHPLRIESVAWVAERKDLLSGFWFLVTLWAYCRFTQRPSGIRYLLVLASLAIGLMCKPMLVATPFILLLLDYWPLRRIAFAEKLPMFMLAAISSFLAYLGSVRIATVNWGAHLPLGLRLSNALISYPRYLKMAIWPKGLALLYPYPLSISTWQVAASVSLLVVLTAALVWFGRHRRYLAVGWLWFIVGLGPVIGIVQVGRQALADRFTYIPLIGLFIVVIWGMADVLRQRRQWAVALAGVAILGYGAAAWSYVPVWRNSVTVFGNTLTVTRSNPAAEHYYAAALDGRGLYDESFPHHAAAAELDPGSFVAQCSYGKALERRGDLVAAAGHYQAAIRIVPAFADARFHLGLALARLGRTAEAAPELKAALDLGLPAADAAEARRVLTAI
jgi:tetratricopeptide (TPR) repeat protein